MLAQIIVNRTQLGDFMFLNLLWKKKKKDFCAAVGHKLFLQLCQWFDDTSTQTRALAN